VFENYSKLLAELEMLIMCKKIKTASGSGYDAIGGGDQDIGPRERILSQE